VLHCKQLCNGRWKAWTSDRNWLCVWNLSLVLKLIYWTGETSFTVSVLLYLYTMTHLLILWLACIRNFHENDKQQDKVYQLWANRVGIHPSMHRLFLQQAEATKMKINTQLENVGLSTVGFNVEQVRDMLLHIWIDLIFLHGG
jgi:hypothetical protein